MAAHLAEFLARREELVAFGELADLIRAVSPALVRCHVAGDSSCPEPDNRVAQQLDHDGGLTAVRTMETSSDLVLRCMV